MYLQLKGGPYDEKYVDEKVFRTPTPLSEGNFGICVWLRTITQSIVTVGMFLGQLSSAFSSTYW